MEFKPRHHQPFTLETAIHLDVPEITQAIARLQISLQHLRDTQKLLKEHLDENPEKDPDILTAFTENEETIESQDERIKMLRFALEQKGASLASNPHYDLPVAEASPGATPTPYVGPNSADEGVFL